MLMQEYEDQNSSDAKFVKDLDKFDMILQAHEYETDQSHLNLQEFFDSTKGLSSFPFTFKTTCLSYFG